ncbi:imidazolonepropionase [Streptomyces pactum]|uniref:Imidazolonepropionase n=1 Tax=Streptomyces pactum TaxID=68249 RepID=A0ABS0NN46_9ACTN|nr:imidazolonepropionase [Streptomyces pactum]MBH5336628.1 imidazolonepropionase [Streptomyces pactum]
MTPSPARTTTPPLGAPARAHRPRPRTTTAVTGIGTLVTNDPSLGAGPLGLVRDAAVVIEGGHIAWVGPSDRAPAADNRVDAQGRALLPGFVDSHSHLVFAGDRTEEFNARMSGRAYSAGGIRTTVAATRTASRNVLSDTVGRHVREAFRQGTTTIEIKSGYGLTVDDEARSLDIAAAHTDEVTYLGAHIVAPEFADRPEDYVALVTGPMLDACAPRARWIDVFCEQGAFDGDQARTILTAGAARGLVPRVHANQLSYGPGVRLAVELGAASADHCTHLTDEDVDALANGTTVATLLPGAEFSTRSPYPDARRLLDAGVTVALSPDCNPGSSYTSSMPFCVALAVREMGMTPDEAVWAATAGGAAALRRTDVGRVAPGARADLTLLDAPSHVHLAYRPGVPLVAAVWKDGVLGHGTG